MRRQTILVVEDDDSFRLSLRKVLEKENYQVLEAADGKEGVRLAGGQNIDLIILDYCLGDMTGADFLQTLQCKPAPPVILLSANLNREMDQKAGELGVKISLIKPITRHDLLEAVRGATG